MNCFVLSVQLLLVPNVLLFFCFFLKNVNDNDRMLKSEFCCEDCTWKIKILNKIIRKKRHQQSEGYLLLFFSKTCVAFSMFECVQYMGDGKRPPLSSKSAYMQYYKQALEYMVKAFMVVYLKKYRHITTEHRVFFSKAERT